MAEGITPIKEPIKDESRNPDGTFKTGFSGNPTGAGRKGSFSIMTLIRKKMEEIPNGQTEEWKEQIAKIILDEAVTKRNPKILQLIVEYMDGKPRQTIELDTNEESVNSLTDLLRQLSKQKDGAQPEPTPTGIPQ